MYFLLLSQATLTQAGTMSLTLNRWSLLTSGRDAKDIEASVRLLEDRRFLVIDWDTEELLIRSFIRNDGVYKQPNVLKAAMRVVLEEVESNLIKAAIADEFLRVGLTEYAARLNPSLKGSGNPSPDPSGGGGGSTPEPSPQPSQTKDKENPSVKGSPDGSRREGHKLRGRGEGGVVSSSPVVGSEVGAATRGTRIPDDFTVTDAMKTWARKTTPLVGKAETDLFVDYWQAETGARASKRDWVKAWQVWMRREQKTAERRPAHLRSVPAPAVELGTFEAFRSNAAGAEAAAVLRKPYLPRPQPPSDPTPSAQWIRDRAIDWIDAHEPELRAALTERRPTG